MMRAVFALLAAAGVALSFGSSRAAAQHDEQLEEPPRDFSSTERTTLELRIGPYQPDLDTFERLYGDDDGLLLGLELDVIAFRLKDILYLSGGGIVSWANYKGVAFDDDGVDTSEETELEIFPLSLLGVLRVDALARKLGVPLVLTGKLGYTWMHWSTETGGSDAASGWSLGYQYAGQLALDLDSFDLAAARVLDEEWGINHSFLFLEIFGFEPLGDSLDLGGTSWTAGLGFVM
jgi:hypothetical protein